MKPKRKRKYIKWTLTSIAGLCILYLLLALAPHMGQVYISPETRASFAMENFYGDETIPERVLLLEDPWESFLHRIRLIAGAETEILLSTFAIHSGITGDIIIGALLDAADRGVSVTIINNAVAGQMPLPYRDALSAHENIHAYLFNRFDFFRPRYLNAALHDKYMVVDGRVMILGGRNIGDKYFAPACFTGLLSLDREVLVYNTDPAFAGSVVAVMDYFHSKIVSGRASLNRRITRTGGSEAQAAQFIDIYRAHLESYHGAPFDYAAHTLPVNNITLVTGPFEGVRTDSNVAYTLLRMAENSQVMVVQSPYVVLTNRNHTRFAQAVYGRDVTLLTNSLASTPNLPSFSNYHISRRRLLATGIQIYEFQSTAASLHAKTYLFDGRLTAIGSFNLNERSIRSDTESMLVIDSEAFYQATRDAIARQFAQSLQVGEDNRYVSRAGVEVAHVSLGKRLLYTAAGHVLRGFRFMF